MTSQELTKIVGQQVNNIEFLTRMISSLQFDLDQLLVLNSNIQVFKDLLYKEIKPTIENKKILARLINYTINLTITIETQKQELQKLSKLQLSLILEIVKNISQIMQWF